MSGGFNISCCILGMRTQMLVMISCRMNETEFIGNGRNYYKKKFLNLFSFFLDLFLLGFRNNYMNCA